MPSVNVRGWTLLDESISTIDFDSPAGRAVMARLDALMLEWSTLHHQEDERLARYRDEDFEPYDNDPRFCDCGEGSDLDPDELCLHDRRALEQHYESERLERASHRLKIELIEAELSSLGARPMRPYEHWNEDERYMEYMERDR